MSSSDFDRVAFSSAHSRPCVGCRKRKVKCDKTRPCANCSRSKQLCTYDAIDAGPSNAASSYDTVNATDGDIRARLARLEELMAKLMVGEGALGSAGRGANFSPEPSNCSQSYHATGAGSALTSSSTHNPSPLPASNSPPPFGQTRPVIGQILFKDGFSSYYTSEFWPGLINEVEDISRLFDASDTDSGDGQPSPWIFPSVIGAESRLSMIDLRLAHPTIEESNTLCKLFFDGVNPFIRVLHESHFGRELVQYRRGHHQFPDEFEALLFSIYTLTVGSLSPEVVEGLFSTTKNVLLARFQSVTQASLSKVHFFKTEKIMTILALLHYVTFLFQQSLYHDAMAMLGVAVRVLQTMGIHRDPSHFPLSPWVSELRRRAWNHLVCLDALAISSYGAESCLPASSDSRPPQHANDGDWLPSRFVKPSSVPSNCDGLTDMTFVLVHREIADLVRNLSNIYCLDFQAKEEVIRQTETKLKEGYLAGINPTNRAQTIIAALVEVKFSSIRLSIRYYQVAGPKSESSEPARHEVFVQALDLLEAFEYHRSTFAHLNWDWVFESIIPWLAIAIAIICSPKSTRQADINRAQEQIEIQFRRHSNPPRPVSSSPMWRLLTELRQQTPNPWSPDNSLGSSSAAQAGTLIVPLPGSEIAFDSDVLLDIDPSQPQFDALMYDDQFGMPEVEDLPWLTPQMGFQQ